MSPRLSGANGHAQAATGDTHAGADGDTHEDANGDTHETANGDTHETADSNAVSMRDEAERRMQEMLASHGGRAWQELYPE